MPRWKELTTGEAIGPHASRDPGWGTKLLVVLAGVLATCGLLYVLAVATFVVVVGAAAATGRPLLVLIYTIGLFNAALSGVCVWLLRSGSRGWRAAAIVALALALAALICWAGMHAAGMVTTLQSQFDDILRAVDALP